MKKHLTQVTRVFLVMLVLTGSGLFLSGCTLLDGLKKQMPGTATTQEEVPYMMEDVQPAEEEMYPDEAVMDAVMEDSGVDPADSIDQALRNLDTLPTESLVNEQ